MNYESICEEMDALSTSCTQKLNEYRQQREYTAQQLQRVKMKRNEITFKLIPNLSIFYNTLATKKKRAI